MNRGETYAGSRAGSCGVPGQEKERGDLMKITAHGGKAGRAIRIVTAVSAACALGIYLGLAVYYHTHFFKGTSVNGQDMSNLTAAGAKAKLGIASDGYRLEITGRDGLEKTISAADISRTYVDNHSVDGLLAQQPSFAWIVGTMRERAERLPESASFDEAAAKRQIQALWNTAKAGFVSPENAYLSRDENGLYTIVPEKEGTQMNEERLEKAVLGALEESRTSLDLDAAGVYEKPSVRSDDASLRAEKESVNRYLAVNVRYDFGDMEEKLDADTILPLLTVKDTTASVSKEAVAELVDRWCRTYSTLDYDFTIRDHSGEPVTVNAGGSYGWRLDREAMEKDVTEALENGASGKREPVWEVTQNWGRENNGLGKTYVEIDLSDQHLYAYRDGETVVSTDVVTGLNNDERRTVNGAYFVTSRMTDLILGNLETKGYETHVDYWLGFCGGQGMHDAWWRSSFGGDIWINDGSHGCVNVPESVMPELYANVDEGEPVVLYY